MSPTQSRTVLPFQPIGPTKQIIEELSRHEIANRDILIRLLFGGTSTEKDHESKRVYITRLLKKLKENGYVHSASYLPDDYPGFGTVPDAFWLSESGAQWSHENLPNALDPRSYPADRSAKNIPHDILRTEIRIAMYRFANERALLLGWKKTGLERLGMKPDDFSEFTDTAIPKTWHFFWEPERRPKNYEDMFEKLSPYVEYRGTDEFKAVWGFRYADVIVPMRSEESAENLRVHLKGDCNCVDHKLRILHGKDKYKDRTGEYVKREPPYKLDTAHIHITTSEKIIKSPEIILDFMR